LSFAIETGFVRLWVEVQRTCYISGS